MTDYYTLRLDLPLWLLGAVLGLWSITLLLRIVSLVRTMRAVRHVEQLAGRALFAFEASLVPLGNVAGNVAGNSARPVPMSSRQVDKGRAVCASAVNGKYRCVRPENHLGVHLDGRGDQGDNESDPAQQLGPLCFKAAAVDPFHVCALGEGHAGNHRDQFGGEWDPES